MSTSSSKTRKVRKGTRSCWECKRRKTRCVFAAPSDAVCVGCRRRATDCIGQELEQRQSVEHGKAGPTDRRIERIEALLEQLVDGAGSGPRRELPQHPSTPPSHTVCEASPTRASNATSPVHPRPFEQPWIDRVVNQDLTSSRGLSQTLFSLLPSQEESNAICTAGEFVRCFFQQIFTRNYLASHHIKPSSAEQMATLPESAANPVLIAAKMLMLASISQYLNPDMVKKTLDIELLQSRMQQLAHTAIKLVTTNDELVRCAEGLECIMLECTYHANNGDLQRAWTAVRRAMAVAQQLGIHRATRRTVKQVDSMTQFDPHYMWYRILYVERFLCLMLGLPQGSSDMRMATPSSMASLSPEECLERQHCAIASRILERNERDPFSTECSVTNAIDESLQNVANAMPVDWWLMPAFSNVQGPRDVFIETSRLVNQLFHFNLINQLYLPYLLRFSQEERYNYCKDACLNAGREVLHRYLTFRTCNLVAHSYHAVDCFALIAAITLLLAHLERCWRKTSSVLDHLRLSDRAMVQQMLRFPKTNASSGPGTLPQRKSRILEQLLAVEDEAYSEMASKSKDTPVNQVGERNVYTLAVPYLGMIRISPDGLVYEKNPDIEDGEISNTLSRDVSEPVLSHGNAWVDGSTTYRQPGVGEARDILVDSNQISGVYQEVSQNSDNNDTLAQGLVYPDLSIGSDGFALQGVELAFLDSFMGGLNDGTGFTVTEDDWL